MRLPALLLLAAIACGTDKDDSTDPTTGTGPSGGTASQGPGTPTGSTTGTPSGTPTGTTTPGIDFCPAWPAATGTVVPAAAGSNLQTALDGLSPGDTLELASGSWTLTTPLILATAGVTVRSATGNPADVVLDGNQAATSIFEVRASDVALVSMTLTNAFEDGVRVQPAGAEVTGLQLYDLTLADNGRYGVSIDADANTFFADDGTIACSRITLGATGRANVRNACTTGGIEAQRARGWTVSDNHIAGFWCPTGAARAGIRFWRGSRDTVIRRNRVEDGRRGIVLGTGQDAIARSYLDQPCGGTIAQHHGGQVHNNLVWAVEAGLVSSASGLQDAIGLESACEAQVLHNTAYLDSSVSDDIVHRYPATSGVIANNLSRGTVRRLDGSTASVSFNVENTSDSTWVQVSSGDFHVAPAATTPIGAGDPQWLSAVPDDIDGETRDSAPDAGWDERI